MQINSGFQQILQVYKILKKFTFFQLISRLFKKKLQSNKKIAQLI